MRRIVCLAILDIAMVMSPALPDLAAPLEAHAVLGTQERASGMEAVERVRWRRRGGAADDFAARYPAGFWEDRARDVEAGTRALAERFGTAVDDGVLERELVRICRTTGSPDRLRELFAALDNDPVRIKECLVRPMVVRRLLRRRIEQDREIQREPLERARELARHPDELESGSPAGCRVEEGVIRRGSVETVDDRGGLVLPEARWRALRRALGTPGTVLGPEDAGTAFVFRVLVSAGEDRMTERVVSIPKVDPDRWWREHRRSWEGNLPPELAAQPGPLPPIRAGLQHSEPPGPDEKAGRAVENGSWEYVWPVPGPMTDFAAVWTGSEMLAFGSADADEPGALGGVRYDPASDTWTPMAAPEGASPSHRFTGWQGVWTGSEMFVIPRGIFRPFWSAPQAWLYDPTMDDWRPAAIPAAPPGGLPLVASPRMVWTGSEVLILGFQDPFTMPAIAGAAYDPVSGTWRALLPPGTVYIAGRDGASLVWTGTEAILWGGEEPLTGGYFKSGVAYNPTTDSWRNLPTAPLSARTDHSAVWTGSRMIVWGGWDGSSYLASGALYDPATNTWTSMASTDTPPGRRRHAAVWTGSRMMIWGGEGSDTTQPGWLYDPAADQWTAMDTTGEPENRTGMALLWAGDRAILWGGTGSLMGRIFSDGATWSADAGWTTIGSPAPQPYEHFFASAWTGNELLVWGGHLWLPYDWYGWRYEPATGTWTPMSSAGQPTWRMGMPGVWTGSRFIVWGGRVDGVETDTGGVYDPVSDTWSATSTTGAPSARSDHTAVWTGSRMVVWGGAYTAAPTTTFFGDGAAYDPDTDSWSPISGTGAPSARRFHTAVWDGSEMVVWGGEDAGGALGDGARYDPSNDTWSPLTGVNAPAARWGHTAVRLPNPLASEMIVWGGTDSTASRDDGGLWTYNGSFVEGWSAVLHDGTQPSSRSDHTAVMTGGKEMIVWGGRNDTGDLSSGGIYDTNSGNSSWRPTDDPSWLPATHGHAAYWDQADDEMLAWGGTSGHRELLVFHPTAVPQVVFTPDSGAVCPGDQVTASTDPGGYASYAWSPGGSTDPSVSFTAGTTVTYSVDVAANGYGGTASATLWVPPAGDVNRDGLRSGGDPLFLTWTIFGLSAPTCADVNGDSAVDARDLAIWITRNATGWN